MRHLLASLLAFALLGSSGGAVFAQQPPVPVEAALAQPAPGPGDFEIPGGAFFTQALPGRTDGAGFAVQDGHGARLWSAFLARGGVEGLGYPISRRFEWDSQVAQAFAQGILRWDSEAGDAQLLPRAALPGGKLPDYAIQPDRPPLVAAELERKPWSGWWWPAFEGRGPTLYQSNGPLDKYDRYVERATGENPLARPWERQEMRFPGSTWAGHCNGWAAASLLEPEPTEPREAFGVTFSVGDLKGLLSDYHFADAAAWTFGEGGTVDPADFHRALLDWVAGKGKGFVLTFEMADGEVWSFPVYRFETAWGPDPEVFGLWRVSTTVWVANPDVPPDFVGLKPYPGPEGKTFQYVLEGDPRDPSAGAWTGASERGRFAHPGRIWYPQPQIRNLERQLASPNLDRTTLDNLLAGR
ncbi:MAG: hypothetical protein HY690_13730 [Chloroflexi bacterium]|nr:hypothetical protein [Chloroflexota bacterium]